MKYVPAKERSQEEEVFFNFPLAIRNGSHSVLLPLVEFFIFSLSDKSF